MELFDSWVKYDAVEMFVPTDAYAPESFLKMIESGDSIFAGVTISETNLRKNR